MWAKRRSPGLPSTQEPLAMGLRTFLRGGIRHAKYQPLTDNEQKRDAQMPEPETRASPQRRTITWIHAYIIFIHLLALTLAGLLLAELCRAQESGSLSSIPTQGRTWSPVHKFIKYKVLPNGVIFRGYGKHNDFSGPPTPAQDRAWNELLKPMVFQASPEDLERAGESFDNATELVGGGYLASLGVYHELHCLRRLRFYLFKEYYYTNMTEEQDEHLQLHLEHCLESIRLTLMCHGNSALYSFWRDPKAPYKESPRTNSKSVCVDWDVVESWSLSRMVDSMRLPVKRPWEKVHEEDEEQR